MNAISLVHIAAHLLFPWVVLELSKRNRMAGLVGPVILCYAVGLVLGNLPDSPVLPNLAQDVAEGAVPVAISLMLLSTKFVSWLRYAKQAAFAFSLAVLAVVIVAFGTAIAFKGANTQPVELWKLSGMLVGVYTGGTPNLAAIGTALNVSNEAFIIVNACDLVLSSIYLLLLLTVAQKLALKFLPSFVPMPDTDRESVFKYLQSVKNMSRGTLAGWLVLALGISVLIVGLSIGFSIVVSGKVTAPNVMLAVTTLSIAASFVKPIRELPKTYELGEYFLLVFCLGIGAISNARVLLKVSPVLVGVVATMMVGTILLHFLLCRIFKVDADTMLITSVAGIFGPAFIGPVASVLKNREIVVSGLTTGLVGYAIANYLGLAIAHAIKAFLALI